jgi:hypothetical protein
MLPMRQVDDLPSAIAILCEPPSISSSHALCHKSRSEQSSDCPYDVGSEMGAECALRKSNGSSGLLSSEDERTGVSSLSYLYL